MSGAQDDADKVPVPFPNIEIKEIMDLAETSKAFDLLAH